MGYFETVGHVVNKADIVLLIVDARMPELARNRELDYLVRERRKQLVYVFNKIDLVNSGDLRALRKNFPLAFFVSGNKNIGIAKLRTGLLIMAKQIGIEFPHIGVVGYPNVGKSAIINALAHGARTKVTSIAGTTRGVQWVKVGKLRVIDSPGVITYKEGEEKLGFIGAKNPEQMQNPTSVAIEIVSYCIDKNDKSIKRMYGVEIGNHDSYEIILEIGKKRGFLKKKGEIDEERTAIQIIRDWNTGKLRV